MKPDIRNQTIALAAMFQASYLIKTIAWEGKADNDAQLCLLNSIFKIDAPSVDDIYGDQHQLRLGLSCLQEQLQGDSKQRNLEISSYVGRLLALERKLNKRPEMREYIGSQIDIARSQLAHYPITHSNLLAKLADIYQQSISTLFPRIHVHGERSYLSHPDNAARIRSLLLAGIRAAVLWRQCGGTRLKLIFGRNKLLNAVNDLMKPS